MTTASPKRPVALHLEEARSGERRVDADFAADLAALAADDAEFLRGQPPKNAAARIKAIAASRQATSSPTTAWFPLVSASALVAAFVLFPRPAADAEVIVAKGGGVDVVAARVGADGLVALRDGEMVGAGDVVQLGWLAPSLSPSTTTTVVVVSIDGRGVVTTHLSAQSHGMPITAARGSLPTSYALDDAPRFERFFLVSGADLDAADVYARAARVAQRPDADVAPFPPPPGAQVSTLLLRKNP